MIVVAAVIVREGLILVCQRNRFGKFPLKWEFPGGKVDKDESPEQALARELKEELGAAAKIGREIFCTEHRYEEMSEPIELIFFEAQIGVREKIETEIFNEVRWVEAHKLSELEFLEADRELVQRLANDRIHLRIGNVPTRDENFRKRRRGKSRLT